LYLNRPAPDYTRLDALLEQAEKKATQKVAFYQLEAESWKRRGVTNKYLNALEQAYKLAPDTATTVVYVSALLDNNQADKVDPILQGVTQKDATWVLAFNARLLAKQKQDSADQAFKTLLETCPGDDLPFVLTQMEKAYGVKDGIAKLDAWKINRGEDWLYCMRLADWYSMNGSPDAAKRSRELLDKAMTLAKLPEQKAETEYRLGTISQQANNAAEAEKYYLSSLKVLPDNVQCLNNLAYLYTNDMGKASEALQYAKKAARLAPTNSDVLDTYGWTLMKLNQLNEALPILQQAVEAEQPAAVCRYHLGLLYEQQGNYEFARNCFKAGLEMLGGKKDDPLYKQCQEALDRIASK
jgi:tetratricopeptide (TPR) repeat protein